MGFIFPQDTLLIFFSGRRKWTDSSKVILLNIELLNIDGYAFIHSLANAMKIVAKAFPEGLSQQKSVDTNLIKNW